MKKNSMADHYAKTQDHHDVPFAGRLFCGEIHADLVLPFPRMDEGERRRVEDLIAIFLDYCADHYDPAAIEAERWIPDSVIADLGEMGMLGLYVEEQYGGQGFSQTAYCRVFQAVGQVDPTLAVVLGVHQSIGSKGIHLFGSDEQKARFLPDLAIGRKLAAFALTEVNAGSDAYHIETTARLQPDGSYLVNGEKRWIGNGSRADVLTTFARTESGAHVALLVESDMDGFDVGERYETLGLSGNDLRRLHFNDVRVPPENVLGREGEGFTIAMEILNNGRMSLGSGAAGSVKLLLDHAIEHATGRRQFGQPLAEFQLVAHKLGQMSTQLYGLESMGYLSTGLVDRGASDIAIESAMVKVAGSEFLWYAANRVFQIVGGEAYMQSAPYAKILRDIRIFPIFEGANDVLRMLIALQGCKELGSELDDMANLDLRDPLRSVGAVAEYLSGRVRRTVSPPGVTGAAPAFADASDRVARQISDLRNGAEVLLRRHGEDVATEQAQLKRLAHVATEAYGQIATISRITDVLDASSSSHAFGDEQAIASSFCERSAARADRSLGQLNRNDDERIDDIASAVIERGSYIHSI